MSKTITSPVKRFPGTVTLSDPLTLPQAIAMEQALKLTNEMREGRTPSKRELNYALLPGVCGCIESGEIKDWPGLSADKFPGTPNGASAELMAWLLNEVVALYEDAEEIPNE